MEKHQVLVDKSRCIGCGLCVRDCPVNHLQLRQQKAQTVSDHCIQCGHCVAVCPKQAVSLSGYACAPVEKPKLDRLDPQALLDTLPVSPHDPAVSEARGSAGNYGSNYRSRMADAYGKK